MNKAKLKIYERVEGAFAFYTLLPDLRQYFFFTLHKRASKKVIAKKVGLPLNRLDLIRDEKKVAS